MTELRYLALPTEEVEALRAGRPDAYGMVPERTVSDGAGNPCRHCLRMIPEGAGMLILAHRPFPGPGPYAETGPIFLCAEACDRHDEAAPPACLRFDPLVKAYLANDRIHYGTGAVIPAADLPARCAELLSDPRNAYVHVRSGRNNGCQFRVERA